MRICWQQVKFKIYQLCFFTSLTFFPKPYQNNCKPFFLTFDVWAKAVPSPSVLLVQWTDLSWHRAWRGSSSEDTFTWLAARTPRNSICLWVSFPDSWNWLCRGQHRSINIHNKEFLFYHIKLIKEKKREKRWKLELLLAWYRHWWGQLWICARIYPKHCA